MIAFEDKFHLFKTEENHFASPLIIGHVRAGIIGMISEDAFLIVTGQYILIDQHK